MAQSSRVVIQFLPSTESSAENDNKTLMESYSTIGNDHSSGLLNDDEQRSIVEEPAIRKGTARQIIDFVNKRINPLEMEPRMYLKEASDGLTPIELVATTKYRDDVRILVDQGPSIEAFARELMPFLNVETLLLYKDTTPKALVSHMSRAFSLHSTLKRIWLKTDSPSDINFEVAASIIQLRTSSIEEFVVEGLDSSTIQDQISAQHQIFFHALGQTKSVKAITFVKTANLNAATMSTLGDSLCKNSSIQRVYLGDLSKIPETGLLQFAKKLPEMKHLQVLDFRLVHRLVFTRPNQRFGLNTLETDVTTFFETIAYALESNSALLQIQGSRRYLKAMPSALQSKIEYHLQLNRSKAKQFVKTPAVSPSLWSLIMAKKCSDNPNAIFYCLREKIVSVCTN